MAKYQMPVLAFVLSVACIITPTVQGKTGTSVQQAKRPQAHTDVVGEVLNVDTAARSMTLRSGRNSISFDISNPVLQGYDSIAAIKKGDRVGAGYTADGTHIAKLSRIAKMSVPERGLPEKSVPAATHIQPAKKLSHFARRMRTDGKSFAEVDNNKDGKISPIELCVVVPDLTMEQFHQYDKNHDGHLDRAEFGQIKLR